MSHHKFDPVFADLFGPAEKVYATMPRPSSLPKRAVNQVGIHSPRVRDVAIEPPDGAAASAETAATFSIQSSEVAAARNGRALSWRQAPSEWNTLSNCQRVNSGRSDLSLEAHSPLRSIKNGSRNQARPATSEATQLTKAGTAPPPAKNNRGAGEAAEVGDHPLSLRCLDSLEVSDAVN